MQVRGNATPEIKIEHAGREGRRRKTNGAKGGREGGKDAVWSGGRLTKEEEEEEEEEETASRRAELRVIVLVMRFRRTSRLPSVTNARRRKRDTACYRVTFLLFLCVLIFISLFCIVYLHIE